MEGIEIIRNNQTLQKAFKFIIKNNKSNYLPYHNINHLLTVLKYCDIIAHGEELYFDQRQSLHLAALFHDVDHAGNKSTLDSVNIANAIIAFSKFCETMKEEGMDISIDSQSEIVGLIDVTQFPYIHPESQLNKEQLILRDADMMQAFEYNWINQITMGLAAEGNLTIEQFIPKQRLFLEGIQFRTKTAQKL